MITQINPRLYYQLFLINWLNLIRVLSCLSYYTVTLVPGELSPPYPGSPRGPGSPSSPGGPFSPGQPESPGKNHG